MKLKFYKKAISATGKELFIFLMNRNWSMYYGLGAAPSGDILDLENFLENLAKDHWYYGGNMHVGRENQNHSIVITDPSAATFLTMSDYCTENREDTSY